MGIGRKTAGCLKVRTPVVRIENKKLFALIFAFLLDDGCRSPFF